MRADKSFERLIGASLGGLLLGAAICLSPQCQARAQAVSTGIQPIVQPTPEVASSPLDSTVFSPVATTALGHQDASATTELTAYTSLLGGGGNWPGLQGTGTITYAAGTTQYSVTFTNLGHDRFRLDTQLPTGVESIRIQGRMGKVQPANTSLAFGIDPDTAILGIFPFVIAERAVRPGTNYTLLDQGNASTNGVALHRLTLELPSMMIDPATKKPKLLPIDLYFDPATHRLVKSACYVFMPEGRRVPFLSVVTYSDYRAVGSLLIPFHMAETLNGQPYRTVQLASVQAAPALSATYFHF